ncbi:hypothetical protein GCM10010174_88690 [Kutzneria viridogrisea]
MSAVPCDNSGQALQLVALVCSADGLGASSLGLSQLGSALRHKPTALILRHQTEEWLTDEWSTSRLRIAPDEIR